MRHSLFESLAGQLRTLALGVAVIVVSAGLAMAAKREFTKEDNNKAVALELNSEIVIRLPVRLGIGSSWKAASLPDILDQKGITFEGGGTPGAEQTQVFRFLPVKKGNGKLLLTNVRPWEPEKALETFTLSITVDQTPG